MSERDSLTFLGIVVLMLMMIVMILLDKLNSSEIRDLQRRVGQLEQQQQR
jgi:hypothetical protein